MKDIQQLEEEFDKLVKADSLAIVKFYESNADSISSINVNKDNRHYDTKMRFQSEYGLSLVSAGYYSKAVSVLKDSIKMFENAPTIDSDNLYGITYFEHLLWNYGMALWEIKKINEAKILFDRLTLNYPKNEKYRAWLNGLKAEKVKKIIRPLWVVFAIWLIAEMTVFEKLDISLQYTLSLVGLLLLATVGVAELYTYLTMKKKASA